MGDTFQWFIGQADGLNAADWVVAGFTAVLVWLACRQDRHFRRTERAYLTVRFSAPGLQQQNNGVKLGAHVIITNVGNTPARLLGFVCGFGTKAEPVQPDRQYGSWLAKGESTTIWSEGSTLDWLAVLEERETLFVFGALDYMDQFGGAYRRGFCAAYSPAADAAKRYFVSAADADGDHQRYQDRMNLSAVSTSGANFERPLTESDTTGIP